MPAPHWIESGGGTRGLLFLHGVSGGAEAARTLLPQLLPQGWRGLAWDMPGYGASAPLDPLDFDTLAETDFVPFRALHDIPWAMTAHIVYSAIDAAQPATLSRTVIAEVIRGEIGFTGLLLSDDLSMKALKGGLDELAQASLDAGCDVVLHCNGDMAEMEKVVKGTKPLSSVGLARYEQGQRRLNADPDVDQVDLKDELSALMA